MEETHGGELLAGLIALAIATALYFLPSIVGRNKRDWGAIFVTNLFLGWTVIGWIFALIWALKHDAPDASGSPSVRVNVHSNKDAD